MSRRLALRGGKLVLDEGVVGADLVVAEGKIEQIVA